MRVVYAIDADDRLVEVNDDWARFARDNDGAALARGVLGQSLWDHIADDRVVAVFRTLLVRVRDGASVVYDYRCDSPLFERHMTMEIDPAGAGGVRFSSTVNRVVERRPRAFLARFTALPAAIAMCGVCARISVDGVWMDVATAFSEGHLFAGGDDRVDVHSGVCPRCEAALTEQA